MNQYKPPGLIKKIYFKKLTFGQDPFRVEGIRVNKNKTDEVEIEVRRRRGRARCAGRNPASCQSSCPRVLCSFSALLRSTTAGAAMPISFWQSSCRRAAAPRAWCPRSPTWLSGGYCCQEAMWVGYCTAQRGQQWGVGAARAAQPARPPAATHPPWPPLSLSFPPRSGTIRVILKPLLPEIPGFGAATVALMKPPVVK